MLKSAAFILCCTVSAVRDKDHTVDLKTRDLPCTLTVKYGQAVRKGENEAKDSFSIELKCSEAVSDGRLKVPWLFKDGEFPLNIKGKDDTDQIEADESVVIWSSHMEKENEYYGVYGAHKDKKMLSYVGSTFKFTAKSGSEQATDEVSVVITEAPETTPPPTEGTPTMTGGDLPCLLTVGDLTPENAAIKMTCTQEVKEVRLITPPDFNNVKFPAMLAADKSYTLMTLQRSANLEGKTFVVEAISPLKSGSDKSNVVSFPGPAETGQSEQKETIADGGLPCLLTSSNAKLVSEKPGFSITMKCDQTITDVHLKIPGYQDRLFNELTPGKVWSLAVYPKQDGLKGKSFFVEATFEEKIGKSNEVIQPA